MMDLQEDLYNKLTRKGLDSAGNPIGLSHMENVQIRTILTSKLDTLVQANIINPKNEKDTHLIWTSINEYFASNHASNRARIFKEFLRTPFSASNFLGFIKDTKTMISQLHKVGIDLPSNIIAYLILEKLPASMDTVVQQITHSNKKVTPDHVLDHLRLYHNNQSLGNGLTSKIKKEDINSVSFYNKEIKPCKDNWHNPRSSHPEGCCWKLYPQLKPSFPKKKKKLEANEFTGSATAVRSFHSTFLQSLLNQPFVLDSGSSAHMVSDETLFDHLDRS